MNEQQITLTEAEWQAHLFDLCVYDEEENERNGED